MNGGWIWDTSGAHPRNYWAIFRKRFRLNTAPRSARLEITADSRYTAWVNGHRIGSGPVRGWPEQPFYDTRDIAEHLVAGDNALSILVLHYGFSNMQYIESDAALTAVLTLVTEEGERVLRTDGTWKTRPHPGYLRDAIRIYPQQGFAEVYDARALDDTWTAASFDDEGWAAALEVDRASPVWRRRLQPRDIPELREDIVYPDRVLSTRVVRTQGQPVSLDLQPCLETESRDMNKRNLLACLATVVKAPKEMVCEVVFPWWRMLSLHGSIRLGGVLYELPPGGKSLTLRIPAGESLLLMDLAGVTHSYTSYFRFVTESPLTFRAPLGAPGRFAVLGPFRKKTILTIGDPSDESLDTDDPDYQAVWRAAREGDLEGHRKWLKPVTPECDSPHSVYDASVYRAVVDVRDTLPACEAMLVPGGEPAVITPPEQGDLELTIDFGRELTGFVELDLDAPAGVIVDFYGLECIHHDGTPEHTEGVHCTLRYVTRAGRQRYRSAVRRGFRYLQTTFRWPDGAAREPVSVRRIFTHLSTAAVSAVGRFSTPETRLDRIWEISRDTTRLCMEDTFVDCPCYEQVFWVGDARGEALIAYYTFGAYEFARRSLLLVAPSLERSPVTESQVPSGWQNVLTAWSLAWMSGCREYVEHSGDQGFLSVIYPALRRCAEGLLDRVGPSGCLEIAAWNMLDWAPMDTPDRGIVTHQNASLVKALVDTAWVAGRLGHRDDERDYHAEAAKLGEALNRLLWSEERGAYRDCIHEDGKPSSVFSVQTNTMVLLADCVPAPRRSAVERVLLDPPADFVKIGSPFVTFFYYTALARMGQTGRLLEDIRRNYGRMLEEGATSCWETYPGWERGRLTRSHCHGWSAAPAYFLGSHVLGVRPLEPGFARVLVDPRLGDLPWARGTVPTPRGPITIRCDRAEGAAVVARVRSPRGVEVVAGPSTRLILDPDPSVRA